MTYTTKDGVTILIDTPEGEKKETRYSHPSFVRACRNNENIASVLDYFVYAASKEAKDRGLPATERKIKVTRKHEQILQSLSHKISRKSLIRYFDSLNEWEMVLSQPYQRDFIVDLDVIQETLKNPPQLPPRIKHSEGLQEKGGQVTTLQPFQKVDKLQRSEVEELREKVDTLQQKVDTLQRESGQLTTFCGQLTTLQRDFEALQKLVQDHLFSSPIITSNILPVITNKDSVLSDDENTPPHDFSNLYESFSENARNSGSNDTPSDTPLTPAGNNTAAEGGNSQAQQLHDLFEQWNQEPAIDDYPTEFERTQMRETDHTAISEPLISATDGLTQESSVTTHSENALPESPLQTQEMPSSTQGVDESNRQATEQANGDDLIATKTIENLEPDLYAEQPFKDRPVDAKRNGRKINPVNERVKWFYDVFTALGVEFFEDETFKADYIYSKNDPMYKSILTYISEGVSPCEMRMAFGHMWNEERDGQYFWQNPDTLTNRAFCKHLRSKIASAKFKKKQEERRASNNRSKNAPVASTPGSQYIVNELDEVADSYIAAMEG